MIIEGVIPAEEIKAALEVLATIKWKPGLTFDARYAEIKQNQELRKQDDIRLKAILEGWQRRIWKHVDFYTAALPLKSSGLRFNRCADGGFYGPHADAAVMNVPPVRSDLSLTIWLTDGYDGGELVVNGWGSFKGKPGSMVLYPSTYVHEVKPVTRGERICAVMWVQSLVKNMEHRQFLRRMHDFGAGIKAREGLTPEYTEFVSLYNNLLRLWSET